MRWWLRRSKNSIYQW